MISTRSQTLGILALHEVIEVTLTLPQDRYPLVCSLLLCRQARLHDLNANSLFALPYSLDIRNGRVLLSLEDGVDLLQCLTLRLDPKDHLCLCEPML